MKKFMLVTLTMILTLSAFNLPLVLAAPAEPPVPVPARLVTTVLSGPAIDGVVPTAKAEFQSSQGQTSLTVAASNLNLPDLTVLTVSLDGTVAFQISVFGGKATRTVSPSPVAIHPGQLITVAIGSGVILQAPTPGTIILSGTF
jgi:hypothetical protein